MAQVYSRITLDRPSRAIQFYDGMVSEGRITQAEAASEFGAFLSDGVKALMNAGAKQEMAVWPKVCKLERSNKAFETYAGTSEPSGIEEVSDGEEYPTMDFTADSTVIVNKTYGGKLRIPRTLLEDDRVGEIRRRAMGIGSSMVKFEDKTIADIFNNGTTTTGYDGSTIFATNHPNVTGGAANTNNNNNPNAGACTAANFETVLRGMDNWVDWDGEPLDVAPRIILTAPGQLSNVLRIVNSAGHVATSFSEGVVNVFQGIGQPLVWRRLTANEWYVVTDIMGLIFQLRRDMEVMQENTASGDSFLRDIYQWRVSKRWNAKVVNWRYATKGD